MEPVNLADAYPSSSTFRTLRLFFGSIMRWMATNTWQPLIRLSGSFNLYGSEGPIRLVVTWLFFRKGWWAMDAETQIQLEVASREVLYISSGDTVRMYDTVLMFQQNMKTGRRRDICRVTSSCPLWSCSWCGAPLHRGRSWRDNEDGDGPVNPDAAPPGVAQLRRMDWERTPKDYYHEERGNPQDKTVSAAKTLQPNFLACQCDCGHILHDRLGPRYGCMQCRKQVCPYCLSHVSPKSAGRPRCSYHCHKCDFFARGPNVVGRLAVFDSAGTQFLDPEEHASCMSPSQRDVEVERYRRARFADVRALPAAATGLSTQVSSDRPRSALQALCGLGKARRDCPDGDGPRPGRCQRCRAQPGHRRVLCLGPCGGRMIGPGCRAGCCAEEYGDNLGLCIDCWRQLAEPTDAIVFIGFEDGHALSYL